MGPFLGAWRIYWRNENGTRVSGHLGTHSLSKYETGSTRHTCSRFSYLGCRLQFVRSGETRNQPFSTVVADLAGVTTGFFERDPDGRPIASGFALLAVCQTLTSQTCQLCLSQRSYLSSHIILFSAQLEIFIGVHDPFAPVADWSHNMSIGWLEMIKC